MATERQIGIDVWQACSDSPRPMTAVLSVRKGMQLQNTAQQDFFTLCENPNFSARCTSAP